MAMAMTMAVSSTSHASNYHVFLSFRGTETRYGFTGNLYKALIDKGICTFIDDEKLQRGDEITPSLVKAIHRSKIAIIVLSKHYASSSFCLDELTTIIHCVQNEGMLVIPVFYKVDPSDVRHLRGTYEDALTKHENRSPQKLQKWKEALRKVADMSGYHFKKGDEYEYKFIESIVDCVSQKINQPVRLHVADHPVGLESRAAEVMKLLDVGSDDVVHMVGIHGMGGVGKSTLARAVYNYLIALNFDGSCYLGNVREKSNKNGLEHLQSVLLQEILRDKNINVTSVEYGASMIAQRLQGKKVLLVIDDVHKLNQLDAIIGRPEWFGLGSRVIITTRDQQLLACHQVKRIYELKELNEDDALQLLTWKALKEEKADPSYEDILNRALTYASGLPLALEVIGSYFFGKSIEDWESAVNQYKRIPPNQIQDILKVSFDTLQEEEKNVFLDIACCLKGYELKEVEGILSVLYDDSMKHHIGVLVDKSLIKVQSSVLSWGGDTVEMHDLIQAMGRQIDEESHKKPQKRKRLWLWKDIIEVLKQNKGTSKIEVFYLDIPKSSREETIEWDGNGFKEMKNLKILIIKNGKFSEGPKCLPNSLRVLEWWGYPSNCLPSDFQPHNLVMCNLPNSCITSFELDNSSKMFKYLTVLKFEGSKSLTQIGDLSGLKNLEILSFEWCDKLVTVHESIGRLGKVKEINAWGCRNLESFPPIHLTSLKKLNLSNSGIQSFPEISGKMENIRRLELDYSDIKEFPISFVNLMVGNITELVFDECRSLAHIPDLSGFLNLEYLSFTNCDKLVTVHESIGRLGKLKEISALGCSNLVSFSPIHLTSLEKLVLKHTGLECFPEILGKMENIRILELDHIPLKELPLSFVNLVRLQEFSMVNSGSVVKFPISILMMPELEYFKAWNWEGMNWVKEEENEETTGSIVSSKLKCLRVLRCNLDDDFFSIIGFTRFAHVTYLDLSGNNFTFLPECIKEFQSLKHLDVSYCEYLQEIRGVPPNIKYFNAKNCKSLTWSSRSMFINEELYEAGMKRCYLPEERFTEWFDKKSRGPSTSLWFRSKTFTFSSASMFTNQYKAGMKLFCVPGVCIPRWFDEISRGLSISLWFRNKLPTNILCLLITSMVWKFGITLPDPMVFINGNNAKVSRQRDTEWIEMDHTYIYELDLKWHLSGVALRKEWNHVEFTYDGLMQTSMIIATGIHVFKGESGMEDIRFSDPMCRKRKLDDYLNIFESDNCRLLKRCRFF